MRQRRVLPVRAVLATALVLVAWLAVAAGARAAAPGPPPVIAGIDLERATIPDLQEAMDAGRLSSARLTDLYVDRIHRVDPYLRSVLTVNPDADELAEASDRRRARRGPRGPLEGIPILLKDNVDTADRQPTTAGSLALLDARPARDATITRRLRRAGAVILGKANLSEWANFRSTEAISGWSAVGGQNVNAYVLDRNPCGSSSGSAVAVSAHLATVSIGTETNGSVVCPAGTNGVVGIKPTLGLVSRAGVVPISAQQDTPGPMGRSVVDAATVLSVVQGTDPRDPATRDARRYVRRDYVRALRGASLRGLRVGLWRSGRGPEVERVLDEAAATMRREGATVVEVQLDIAEVLDRSFAALLPEFKHDLNAYLAATPGEHPADLAGLIDFNRRYASLEMPLFGQELFEQAQATSGDLTDPAYLEDRRAATEGARALIDDTLAAHDLDVIAGATNGPGDLNDPEAAAEDPCPGSASASTPAATGGYPNVTVPAGTACGALPLGVSFFAGRFAEPEVLAAAAAFEQATRARRAPELLPTLP